MNRNDRQANARHNRFSLLVAALAVLGTALVLAREATYGVGLHGDWATYISVARSLLAGDGFVQIHGWAYLHWPPLYPLLLAAASLTVLDPYDIAGPLNAAVFGLTLFVAAQYLRRYVQHHFLVLWACLAIMLAIPLTRVASHAISEAPFILFVTLSLVRTSTFLDTGKRSDLIWAAAFASLAFLTRYIGVTLIITTLPLLIFQRAAVPLEKAKRIGLYLLIAALPVALWLLRNVLVYGSYYGPRSPSPYTLLEILDKFFSDLGGWVFFYLPSGNVEVAAALVGVALLALAMFVGHAFIRSCRKVGTAPDGWSSFYLFGGFALVYLVFLTASQAATEILPLGERYLSPAYIPLLFTAVFALDKFLENLWRTTGDDSKTKKNSWGRVTASLSVVILVITLSLWLAGQVVLNVHEIRQNNEGQGLGIAPVLVNSELLRYIEEHLMAERIFSNASSVIYLGTDHADYHYLPPEVDTRKDIENAVPGAYVAWMDSNNSRDIAVVRKLLGLELVAKLSDGSIYRVTRSGADPAPAYFISVVAPMAGEPFGVKLSAWLECRRSRDQAWQWERGSDATGWTKVTTRGPTYQYTPTSADVGHRLRAYVYCTDKDGKTIRAMTAPSAPVAYDRAGALWSAWQSIDIEELGSPSISSDFNVYLDQDQSGLIYTREQCVAADLSAMFFLHVIPVDVDDLPDHRQQYGFESFNFRFDDYRIPQRERCVAAHDLPDYALAGIRTGQYRKRDDGSYENFWEAEASFAE